MKEDEEGDACSITSNECLDMPGDWVDSHPHVYYAPIQIEDQVGTSTLEEEHQQLQQQYQQLQQQYQQLQQQHATLVANEEMSLSEHLNSPEFINQQDQQRSQQQQEEEQQQQEEEQQQQVEQRQLRRSRRKQQQDQQQQRQLLFTPSSMWMERQRKDCSRWVQTTHTKVMNGRDAMYPAIYNSEARRMCL